MSSPQEPDDEGDGDVDPVAVARRIVTRRLAARAHTRHELAEVLRKRRVPESAAQAVLDRMEELGLVDDVDFAQEWVSSRQRRRHLSAAALRRELQDRGVDRDTVDAALSGLDPDQELASARELIRRRSSTLRALAPEVRYRRLAGLLARRGYSSAVATRLLAEERDADDRGAEATTTRGPDLGDPRGTRGDGVIRRA